MWCNQISWQRYNKWEKKSLLPWCHFRPWSSQRSSPSQASSGVHRLCREVFGLWPFSGRKKKDAYNFMKNVSASMRTELTSQPKRREQDSHYTLKLTVFDYIQTSHCNKDIVNLKRNYSEGLKPNYCIFNVSSLIINTITLQNKPIMPLTSSELHIYSIKQTQLICLSQGTRRDDNSPKIHSWQCSLQDDFWYIFPWDWSWHEMLSRVRLSRYHANFLGHSCITAWLITPINNIKESFGESPQTREISCSNSKDVSFKTKIKL